MKIFRFVSAVMWELVTGNGGHGEWRTSAKKVVRSVAKEDSRAKNVIICGLEEREMENLTARIGEMFEEIGEKPKAEAVRIRMKRSGQTRPEMVKIGSVKVATKYPGVPKQGGWGYISPQ